jgi:dTMP kinase
MTDLTSSCSQSSSDPVIRYPSSLFLTFEGGEGSGKSTQVTLLAERLRAEGREVVTTREPGGTAFAEETRHLLLHSAAPRDAICETLLLLAARRDHAERVIRPALALGAVVICDRFTDSTLAYQGAAGLSASYLLELQRLALGTLIPDRTFLLDLPPEIGLARARNRGPQDVFEGRELAFHHALRESYLRIAAAEPERVRVVDATQSVEVVAMAITRHLPL